MTTPHSFLTQLAEHWQRLEITAQKGRNLGREQGLNEALSMIRDCGARKGKLLFIGNGGSAAIASHQAVDFWKNARIKALAFNDASLLTCISNDCGYENVFAEPLKMFAESQDLLIAISSSGKSVNILRAVEYARSAGCKILTLSGFEHDNPLRSLGDWNVYVPSGSYGIVEVSHLAVLHSILTSLLNEEDRV